MVHQKGTSLQGPVYNEEYGFGRFGVFTIIFCFVFVRVYTWSSDTSFMAHIGGIPSSNFFPLFSSGKSPGNGAGAVAFLQ